MSKFGDLPPVLATKLNGWRDFEAYANYKFSNDNSRLHLFVQARRWKGDKPFYQNIKVQNLSFHSIIKFKAFIINSLAALLYWYKQNLRDSFGEDQYFYDGYFHPQIYLKPLIDEALQKCQESL